MIQNTSACHKEVKRKFYIGIFSLICCIRRMFQFLCLLHNNRGSLLLSSFQMLPQFFWLYLLSFLSDDGGPFLSFLSLFIWWCSAATLTRMRACLSFSHHLYRLFTSSHRPHIRRGPFNKWRIISPPAFLWDSQWNTFFPGKFSRPKKLCLNWSQLSCSDSCPTKCYEGNFDGNFPQTKIYISKKFREISSLGRIELPSSHFLSEENKSGYQDTSLQISLLYFCICHEIQLTNTNTKGWK